MRYILNNSGFIEAISFSNELECNNKTCVEYTGSIPSGYESLAEWSENANINAYKIVNGNLTYDSARDAELQTEWAEQGKNGEAISFIDMEEYVASSVNSIKEYADGKIVNSTDGSETDKAPSVNSIKTYVNRKVTSSMDGNSTSIAPSVSAVKNYCGELISNGSANSGYYTKLPDGTLICYGTATIPSLSANGGTAITVTFPTAFINTNYKVSLTRSGTGAYWSWLEMAVTSKATNSMGISIWNNSSGRNDAYTFDYMAIGRWK